MICNIQDYLSGRPYPGRGLLLGGAPQGGSLYALYFIMGRSANSRNRVFTPCADGVRTKAADPAQLQDPSLIIYRALGLWQGRLILSNGDQTDTIIEGLQAGQDFPTALAGREFEPDAPHYTPRISGLIQPDGSYSLSILKSREGDPGCCLRQYFYFDRPQPGLGHLLHTYDQPQPGQDRLPSFRGEPVSVAVRGSLEEYAQEAWQALDQDNRVALLGCRLDLAEASGRTVIINKYQETE